MDNLSTGDTMMPKTQVTDRFARGFPALLSKESYLTDPIEPGLSLPLLLLLRSEGLPLDYAFVDVVSGHATQFIYAIGHPECFELAFEPPIETLFKALHLTWQETTPSDTHTTFQVLSRWVSETGKPALARLSEPMLIFGVSTAGLEDYFHIIRSHPNPRPERIRVLDMDLTYWRQPVDEGNELVRIIEQRSGDFSESDLARRAARRAVYQWHAGELATCAAGEKAYLAFASDLRDSNRDFTGLKASAWGCSPIYQQWTARYSASRFFERMAPRFGGKTRGALEKAAFYYHQCCQAWHDWDRELGRPWNWSQSPKLENEKQLQHFYHRWKDPKRRAAGADCVEQAMDWERKAVTELTKVTL